MSRLVAKQAITLAALSGLSTLGLMWSSLATAPAIEAERRREFETLLGQVIPSTLYDNSLQDATVAFDVSNATGVTESKKFTFGRKGETVTAVAFKTYAKGYAGPIEVLMAVDRAGSILGVRITSHAETPGLGDKIEAGKSDWIYSFNGKSLGNPPAERWTVKKDGGDFDAFTGATITPRAVVVEIKAGLEMFERERARLLAPAPSVSPEQGAKP